MSLRLKKLQRSGIDIRPLVRQVADGAVFSFKRALVLYRLFEL